MKQGTFLESPQPNLADYDWIVVSSSAGKDSQAMLDYVCELAESGGMLDVSLAEVRDALRRGEEPGAIRTWRM